MSHSTPAGWNPIPESNSLGDVIAPCVIKGGALYVQNGWFVGKDVPQTEGVLREFQGAHATAAAAAGLTPEQIAVESEFFTAGPAGVWKTVRKLRRSGTDVALFVSWGTRLVITSLSPAVVRSVATVAKHLRAFRNGPPSPAATKEISDAFCSGEVSPLPVSDDVALLLTICLNVPQRGNAYVYSRPSSDVTQAECICWQATLDLDFNEFEAARQRTIPKPLSHQLHCSRLFCLWCGALPLAKGVELKECSLCKCVAYCSDKCREMDWLSGHELECGQTKQHTLRSGAKCQAQHDINITRAMTEASKEYSMKTPYPSGTSGFKIMREAIQKQMPGGQMGVLAMELGWVVQADPTMTTMTTGSGGAGTNAATSCGECGAKNADMLRCSRCKVVRYCNAACQKKNWPAHKKSCVPAK